MPELDFKEKLKYLTMRQREIAQAALDWGYGTSPINRRPVLWEGRTVLDIGMGGGPHCIPFLLGGASGYVGVDPLVGTEKVRDRRSQHDAMLPKYRAFPFSVDAMMAAFSNLHLYSGLMEDVSDAVKTHKPELVTLTSVTEHLRHLESVIRSAHEVSAPNAILWISHANYYSWTGHHRPPRTVEEWMRARMDTYNVTDWRHLEPDHPCYLNRNCSPCLWEWLSGEG